MPPLSGLRVIAVEVYGAGPFGTAHLADLGAEVIKIEQREGGDVSRAVGPYFLGEGDSHFFQSLNRNKKSLTLDLKQPRGQEVLHRLAATADGLMGNLRGDQPEKLGLTYQGLSKANPKIVCAHLSAYGRDGARKGWPGYDYLMQGEAGYLSLTGEPDGPPARMGLSVVDYSTGTTCALALLAGLDVQTGKVFATTPKTTGIAPFMDLVAQVMARPEYRDAPRVFVIVDNGSDHRGQAATERLRKAHPNAIMIHTPVHASWLNQIEIFFSIVQKKVVSPNDFASLEQLSGTLLAFIDRYNQTAKPFTWKYTATDLTGLLRRIGEHERTAAAHQADLAPAA